MIFYYAKEIKESCRLLLLFLKTNISFSAHHEVVNSKKNRRIIWFRLKELNFVNIYSVLKNIIISTHQSLLLQNRICSRHNMIKYV